MFFRWSGGGLRAFTDDRWRHEVFSAEEQPPLPLRNPAPTGVTIPPTLAMEWTPGDLPAEVTDTPATNGSSYDAAGVLDLSSAERITHDPDTHECLGRYGERSLYQYVPTPTALQSLPLYNISVSPDTEAGPAGAGTADLVTAGAISSDSASIYPDTNLEAPAKGTVQAILKAGTGIYATLAMTSTTGPELGRFYMANYNIAAGSVTDRRDGPNSGLVQHTSIVPAGAGFFRAALGGVVLLGTTIYVASLATYNAALYGTTSLYAEAIYTSGALAFVAALINVTDGNYPTSIIGVQGTRSKDTLHITDGDWTGAKSWKIKVRSAFGPPDTGDRQTYASMGTAANGWDVFRDSNREVWLEVRVGSVVEALVSAGTLGDNMDAIIGWRVVEDDCNIGMNEEYGTPETDCAVPTTTAGTLLHDVDEENHSDGTIRRAWSWLTALIDGNLGIPHGDERGVDSGFDASITEAATPGSTQSATKAASASRTESVAAGSTQTAQGVVGAARTEAVTPGSSQSATKITPASVAESAAPSTSQVAARTTPASRTESAAPGATQSAQVEAAAAHVATSAPGSTQAATKTTSASRDEAVVPGASQVATVQKQAAVTEAVAAGATQDASAIPGAAIVETAAPSSIQAASVVAAASRTESTTPGATQSASVQAVAARTEPAAPGSTQAATAAKVAARTEPADPGSTQAATTVRQSARTESAQAGALQSAWLESSAAVVESAHVGSIQDAWVVKGGWIVESAEAGDSADATVEKAIPFDEPTRDHARKQIRAAIVAALQAVPAFGGRVFPSRTVPASDADLPCALVYTRTERSQLDGIGEDPMTRPVGRRLTVMVVGCVRAAAPEPHRILDLLASGIEAAIAGTQDLGGRVQNIELVDTRYDVPTEDGDRRAARVGLTWRVEYRTPAGAPHSFV